MDNRTERFHFGAFPKSDGVYFSVWAPEAKTVEISVYEPKDFSLENSKPIKTISLTKKEQEKGAGVWELLTKEVKSGALYKYTVDGKGPFPDPSSRFQPHGVHGPSQVIDPTAFKWNDQDWTNRLKDPKSRSFAADLIIYELHIGTFTKEGTYKSAQQKLDYLKELGITAIEILPLSDFPGRWNWGYDGVMLYSPARCYGDPDELREFIDAAHSKGLYVLLDAVYNHFGPDGNYTGCYSPYYFTEKHHTPWGPAPNIDLSLGKDKSSPEYMNALQVRRFLIENGIYWIEEFHFDGFRLDATHALVDNSTPHFLLEFVQSCNNNVLGKNVFVFAEDDRNSTLLLKEPMEGYGLDGAWADDFHHQVRVNLAGDRESYFANFTGETKDLAKTIKQGWFYTGQLCGEEHRGTDPTIIPLMSKFSYCIQNHDQIGNRAFGDRLNHKINGNAYKVASALVLLVPQTPLLFMGQEFSSKSPFQFFTDHNESLGKLVTEGRRKEFAKFSAFNDPQLREKIPDPQAESTFVNSKLNFDEISMKEHKNIFEFYKKLIAFRKSEDALKNCERSQFDVVDLSESAIGLLRKSNQKSVLAIFNFNGNSVINLDEALTKLGANSKKLTIAFTSDDDLYRLENDSAPVVTLEEGVEFQV